jgi:hypothetical protein
MSRNGSGTYTLPAGNPVVTGTTISSTWANNTLTDIASALTDSVAADGQTAMTGPLNMNSQKIQNLATGTAPTDASTVAQVTSAVAITGGTITGVTINNSTIGATTPSTGAFTTISATGDGTFSGTGQVKLPVGTTAQRSGTPVDGMLRYNSDLDSFEGYVDGAWGGVGGAQAGGVIYENNLTITANYTLTTNKNGLSVGPITINGGVTVTVPSGQRWLVL